MISFFFSPFKWLEKNKKKKNKWNKLTNNTCRGQKEQRMELCKLEGEKKGGIMSDAALWHEGDGTKA